MVSKKNFQQNGRAPNQRQGRGPIGAAPYTKPFKQQGGPQGNNGNSLGMMFNGAQIPANPGYIDFSNPTPPAGGAPQQMQKKKPQNKKGKNKAQPQQQQQQQQQQNGNWNKNKNQQQMMNNGGGGGNRFGNGPQRGFPNGGGRPMPNRGRRMMGPPMGPGGMMGGPMPPHLPMNGFQPPMIPPMPPMGRGPMPPMGGNPHFLRRNGRNGPMPPIPPQIPAMMGPPRARRGPQGGGMPPAPFNGIAPMGKIKKPNPKMVKKAVKGKSTIKTLKNLVNQYPLDKPWVTDDIRAEHAKKVDIENRLKGNKDDDLFAQFKVQRDKFVSMYEAAREEHLKKAATKVKSKDDKDKQTKKTAAKDGIKKEENATKA